MRGVACEGGGVWKVCVHTMCLHEGVYVCPCLGRAMSTCVYLEA